MQAPQFEKGQVLTAEELNQLSQNQRDLAHRVGSAGYSSTYAGPQQPADLPPATGLPTYLTARDVAGGKPAGVYGFKPWVEDSFRTQFAEPPQLEPLSNKLAPGYEIFQKIEVDDFGRYQNSEYAYFPPEEAPAPSPLWEPGSASSVELYRRIGTVIADPRFEPTRPLVVHHSDGSIPLLPRNAAAPTGSAVCLVGALEGSTIPIKRLVAGSSVMLLESGSSVEIHATGGGSGVCVPAESQPVGSGSVLNIQSTPGHVDGICYDPQQCPTSVDFYPVYPTISAGRINLFPGILGFRDASTGSSVLLPNVYTGGAQQTRLASLQFPDGTTRHLCANYSQGILELSFT